MRLALAPEVIEAEEAQVVGVGADEDTVVDARAVGGVLGKRASGTTESYQDSLTLISKSQNPSNQAGYGNKRRDRFEIVR
jgi:hypothetical protein